MLNTKTLFSVNEYDCCERQLRLHTSSYYIFVSIVKYKQGRRRNVHICKSVIQTLFVLHVCVYYFAVHEKYVSKEYEDEVLSSFLEMSRCCSAIY